MKRQLEIERKYDVDHETRVPELMGVGPVATTTTEEAFTLRAVYFDTAEHLLLTNRITLRRREGGHDAGWHVKLPASRDAESTATPARHELHASLGAAADEPLPAALRSAVEVILRGRPLHPVLVLETRRTVTTLLDIDGDPLGEVADDEVTATNPDTAAIRSWREWEVELAPGVGRSDGEAVLDAVGGVLESAGASVSASKSKLARGLGDSLPGTKAIALPGDDGAVLAPSSAGEFLLVQMAALVDDLERLDPPARDGADDAVHRFRVTVRRLRGLLRVYSGIIDPETASALDAALAPVSAAAGVARDIEVAEQQLALDLADAPEGLVTHDTLARLRASLGELGAEAGRDLSRILNDVSYFETLDRLDALIGPGGIEAITGDSADKSASKFAALKIAKESKRARRRAVAAADAYGESGGFDAELLHRARKAARRLRYAIDAQRGATLKGSVSPKAAHALQDALGDALDAHAASERYRAAADVARWAGEDTFGYGVLTALALARRDRALRRLPKLAEKL
ncbi:CYTH and CHAD domain-containing protein [Frondihabitans sp. VKM Ac-2883]|uniref:CYTH and CHAD domain-containing protein n=1 Tax=Frondihabitans sp. VKM Ac-2883 TaxID=2783823 RepID=UPI001889E1EF|nr:CYTH and CHAD domain-containing protein [Frondihabitans sp. VKM Ac-2883]MBF4576779.1 CYTH and CHAD domain-containing protein [Frondihabitans sp. VKM Ac-2883]